MATSKIDVEVIVIGGGPVGLVSALQLGRAGVSTFVAERRKTLSRHPKASGIHARTMEIYRQWGIADAVRNAGGRGTDDAFTVAWMTRLKGLELGAITVGGDAAEQALFKSWSPESHCFAGQNAYEPVLADAARESAAVEIKLGIEALGLEQDKSGVTVTFKDHGSGETFQKRALYVIGADGVHSSVRGWTGLDENAEPAFGNSINVSFRGPLEHLRREQHLLYWTINKDTQGAFVHWRNDQWTYNFEAAPGEDPAIYNADRCTAIVKAAIGEDLPIEVISILHWRHDQAVTDRWRVGRVFVAGDAAHRFPPHGGFGMNSGVQDSLNLIWKLVAVLRRGAGEGLLDTYEAERRPVATMNADQCILNTRRMEQTGWLLSDPSGLAKIETPEGAELRAHFGVAIPAQRAQFFSHGQQFGYIYESTAVLQDGTDAEQSTVTEYRPTAHPGARAPNVWLLNGRGESFSNLDLIKGDFLLMTGAQGGPWVAAAAALTDHGDPVKSMQIGSPGFSEEDHGSWCRIYGVSLSGAVLVRPDGHVAARWKSLPSDPEHALRTSLDQLLARG
jgi:putative polyketide hydroxylase